jgi:hypothetical protein
MVVVTVIGMIVMGLRRVGAVAVRVIVMLDRVAAGIARMRAKNRDQAGENSADQRQKDDCLDHLAR